MQNRISKIILSVCYLGRIKFAPGTIASLVCVLMWFFIPYNLEMRFCLLFLFLLIGFYFCWEYSKNAILGEDPSMIVIDEFSGMSIALCIIEPNVYIYLSGFLLFRFFDILKPSFIYASQKVEHGIGIMLDDILSGIIVLFILIGISF